MGIVFQVIGQADFVGDVQLQRVGDAGTRDVGIDQQHRVFTPDGDADGQVDGREGLALAGQRAGDHDQPAVAHHGAQAAKGVVQQAPLHQTELLVNLGGLVVRHQEATSLQVIEIQLDDGAAGRGDVSGRGMAIAAVCFARGGRAVGRAVLPVCRALALCGREGGTGRSLGVDPGTTRCRVQPAVDLLAALTGLPQCFGAGDVGPDAGGHRFLGLGRGSHQRGAALTQCPRRGRAGGDGGCGGRDGGVLVHRPGRILVHQLLHGPLNESLVHDITFCWVCCAVGAGAASLDWPASIT
mgnify:CR=1 FL=1